MIFKKNIEELKKVDPDLADAVMQQCVCTDIELILSKKNVPSLRVGNVSLHSHYDPIGEAEAWVRHRMNEIEGADSFFVFGFGLGYHLLELCKQKHRRVVVFEPRKDILRKALESVDLAAALSRIRIITDAQLPDIDERVAVLKHSPSTNLSRQYFEDMGQRIRASLQLKSGLRIMVVGPIFGGSLPVAGYCSKSLMRMGQEVEFVDNSRFHDDLFLAKNISKERGHYNRLVDLLTSFASEVILARCEEFKPDIVLALAQAPMTPECLEKLKQKRVTLAYWFVEDFRVMDYWRTIAPFYDYFFTIQQGSFFNELKKAGIRNYHYLPMAACPDVHAPLRLSEDEKNYYGSDLSFVGAGYYNRREFLKGLLDLDFKIWGSDWDMTSALSKCIQRSGERIGTSEIVKIFNATKININLHSSTCHRGINPFGDFINPRTFEILSCGGFQLVDRRSILHELLEPDDEIVLFDDLNDLRSKALYYLHNPEERKTIARKGRQRLLKEHTYERRMNEMTGIIAGKGFERTVWERAGEPVGRLLEEAEGHPELSAYLSRFSGKDNISLSDITGDIAVGEGSISRTEALFLMMHEFVR